MRQLIIAEKPSVATALAELLGVTQRGNGYWVCGDVYISSCFGHLFELPYPEFYNPDFKRWSFDNLPIVPQFVALPKTTAKDRIKLLGQLLKDADEVVNAGDPDNEGQLLVDQVIEHFKFKRTVLRLWANAQDPASLDAAMRNLQDNRKFSGMRDAARARGEADWLIGMNLSRAFTLRSQAFGNAGAIPVGRVKTPTLAMVARRDAEVANFRPTSYHLIVADVHHAQGSFRMRWQPREDQAGFDHEGRLVDTAIADELIQRLSGGEGAVTAIDTKTKSERQPKGLSLAGIGLLASKLYNFTAKETLETCQALYEKHKLASYPRTDCEFLPEEQHSAAPVILAAVRDNLPQIAAWIDVADPSIKSRTWDSSKTTAHHGIIPTAMVANMASLTTKEARIYMLIARSYIAQFFPEHTYEETTVHASTAGENFAARGKIILEPGWKQLYQAATEEEGDDDEEQSLPVMSQGDALQFNELTRRDLRTKPPKRFTEGTLPPAMENIYRYIDNEADKASLKEGDGIGTPATRGAIIEELKQGGFLQNDGKWLVCTELGRHVLSMLPPDVQSPALTALFQRQLKEIEQGGRTVAQFTSEQVRFVEGLIGVAKLDLPEVERFACGSCSGQIARRTRKDGKGHFWSCERWRDGCKFTADDADGRPSYKESA